MARTKRVATRAGVLSSAYARYRYQAKRRKKEWDLTLEEFDKITSANCHYCGTPPGGNHRGFLFNGIDRVNNDYGYLFFNCVPACGLCNFAKRGNSVQEFYEWIEKVVKLHGERTLQGREKTPAERGKEGSKGKKSGSES